ncbi:MAG: gliding motility-associated C-terminal domain-containing protein [Fluviicola sp.]
MIEKDNIQELFSKAFENQTAPVRPDLWAGVQAKMAAAGVASTATVATKGLSALTKWIIGSAAVGTVGVVTAVVALNSGEETTTKQTDSPKEIAQNTTVTSPEKENTGKETFHPSIGYSAPVVIEDDPAQNMQPQATPYNRDPKEDIIPVDKEINSSESNKADKVNVEDKSTPADNIKKDVAGRTEKPAPKNVAPADHKKDPGETTPVVKHPENITEPVFADLKAEVTDFPNIFTPNGGGVNDIYFVKIENIDNFMLVIIDQNNREVFSTNLPGEENGWNGRTKSGDEAPSGSYAAIVTGKQKNGKSFRDIQLFELKR